MPKKTQASATAPAESAAFLPVIHNATAWAYPIDLHIALCNQLRVNPTVWILPVAFRDLLAEHFPKSPEFAEVDAFSDETGNVVYFWSEDWTDDYAQWVMCHELYHQSQYFDKGNMYGSRWEGLEHPEMIKIWEREANNFANKYTGKRLHDFTPYKSMEEENKKPKKGGRKRAPRS
jgi:hypothetical protein